MAYIIYFLHPSLRKSLSITLWVFRSFCCCCCVFCVFVCFLKIRYKLNLWTHNNHTAADTLNCKGWPRHHFPKTLEGKRQCWEEQPTLLKWKLWTDCLPDEQVRTDMMTLESFLIMLLFQSQFLNPFKSHYQCHGPHCFHVQIFGFNTESH